MYTAVWELIHLHITHLHIVGVVVSTAFRWGEECHSVLFLFQTNHSGVNCKTKHNTKMIRSRLIVFNFLYTVWQVSGCSIGLVESAVQDILSLNVHLP